MTSIARRDQPAAARPRSTGRTTTSMMTHTLRSWFLTTDHKRIGILYLISITGFFIIGAIAAGLVRLALVVPDGRSSPTTPTTSCSPSTAS